MNRRLFNVLALLPLLLSMAVWAWSYLPHHFYVQALGGDLLLIGTDLPEQGAPGNVHWVGVDAVDDISWDWNLAGFRRSKDETSGFTTTIIAIPMYAVTLGAAALTFVLLATRHRRQSRIVKHQCLNCGYDLRATPDRCPECGTITPKNEIISS